ncbi:hypothetical protein KGO06_00630 [Patescibacteria group bacterium]|nr:hypothetical protein [Patescibacteria group bacterium]
MYTNPEAKKNATERITNADFLKRSGLTVIAVSVLTGIGALSEIFEATDLIDFTVALGLKTSPIDLEYIAGGASVLGILIGGLIMRFASNGARRWKQVRDSYN